MFFLLILLQLNGLEFQQPSSMGTDFGQVPLVLSIGSASWSGMEKPSSESQIETHVNLITLNERLRYGVFVSSAIAFLSLGFGFYWRRKLRGAKIGTVKKEGLTSDSFAKDTSNELESVKNALNLERAKVVRHEVQKKELIAYIEELKAIQGSFEVRNKTNQIHRIFADQKTDDISRKVESTARVLYPELIEKMEIRYPELNRLELQYCMMLVLGYNLDEVMSVLGRSEKAIKSLRYRIRKKLSLDDSQSLTKFIQSMNE